MTKKKPVKRQKVLRERNNNTWSEARFNQFIDGLLRGGLRKWGPTYLCIAAATVSYGIVKCAKCSQEINKYIKVGGKRRTNIDVDHIQPVCPPETGRLRKDGSGKIDWNLTVDRMYVEVDKLNVLCKPCHKVKTREENRLAHERRRAEKCQTKK